MKKICVMVVAILLVALLPMSAMAVSKYCGPCGKTTNWVNACYPAQYKPDSAYKPCAKVDTCNYYIRYNKNGQVCTVAHCNNKVVVSGKHDHYRYHTTSSHNYKSCAY